MRGDVIPGAAVCGRRATGTSDARQAEADARLQHLAPEDLRINPSRDIQSLPDHYREVIPLRGIEELSMDEIAGVLELTRDSVRRAVTARGS